MQIALEKNVWTSEKYIMTEVCNPRGQSNGKCSQHSRHVRRVLRVMGSQELYHRQHRVFQLVWCGTVLLPYIGSSMNHPLNPRLLQLYFMFASLFNVRPWGGTNRRIKLQSQVTTPNTTMRTDYLSVNLVKREQVKSCAVRSPSDPDETFSHLRNIKAFSMERDVWVC